MNFENSSLECVEVICQLVSQLAHDYQQQFPGFQSLPIVMGESNSHDMALINADLLKSHGQPSTPIATNLYLADNLRFLGRHFDAFLVYEHALLASTDKAEQHFCIEKLNSFVGFIKMFDLMKKAGEYYSNCQYMEAFMLYSLAERHFPYSTYQDMCDKAKITTCNSAIPYYKNMVEKGNKNNSVINNLKFFEKMKNPDVEDNGMAFSKKLS